MCGVVGYVGKNDGLSVVLNGLYDLEYRGYDSAGVCGVGNGKLVVVKKVGKVEVLERCVSRLRVLGRNKWIAHTRWATHGPVTEQNAHPHVSCNGEDAEIAIVHNGIVDHHDALKKMLLERGHRFVSETDSEVIAHLIEELRNGDGLEQAVIRALKFIKGTYGLLVISKDSDNIIAAKRGSPLILGKGEGEMFVASDAAALCRYTQQVVHLDDGEVAIITKDGYSVKALNGDSVNKKVEEIHMTVQQIQKGGFTHFMQKEIEEQPDAMQNTMRGRIVNGKVRLDLNFKPKQVKRITIVACGTSYHAGLVGEWLIESIARIPVKVEYASQFKCKDPIIRRGDVFVAISQSGETADVLAALRPLKTKSVTTMGIVNVVGSSIARLVDSGIYLHAGPEISVASTKAFVCQVTALVLFAVYLKQEREGFTRKDILEELSRIPDKIRQVLTLSNTIRDIAMLFKDKKNCLDLGQGVLYPIALEGALKRKEVSYRHDEGMPAAEMKHGSIALIDEQMPVVFLASNNDQEIFKQVVANMEIVRARGGKIIAITSKNSARVQELAHHLIRIPDTLEELAPLVHVIPLQLLAYHTADLLGLDVDQPKNLAKSVTV